MLIWMREGAGAGVVKFILLSMLLMAVAGLVLMDVGGFFRTGMSDSTVVKGSGIKISLQQFDRTVRRAISQQQQASSPQEAYASGKIEQILQGEVQNLLFSGEAKKFGLLVGDEDVLKQVAKIAQPLAKDGRTMKDALQQVLQAQGISEGEFVHAIREEMANGLLREVLMAPTTLVSPSLTANLYRYDNEKRSVKVVILNNASITDVTKPTEDNLKKYYDANKRDYMIPETRTITIGTLSPAMVKKSVTISDEDLRAEYEKNIPTYTKPALRTVEQAVFATEAEAKKAVESMKSEKSLKDSSGKDAYLGSGDYDATGLQPELAKAVFDAAENATVGPIKSPMGWHVAVVTKIVPEFVMPFDVMKGQLKTEMEQSALTDEMYQVGNAIEDRIAGGDKLEDLVKEYGITTETVGPFYRNGMSGDGNDQFKPYASDRDKLLGAAFDYQEGEISNLIETADGQFHVVHIDKVVPNAYRGLDVVHADVEKRWLAEQRNLLGKTRAKSILDAVNGGKSLEDAAKENNATVRTFDNINRKDEAPAPLTLLVAAQVFTTDVGKNFSTELNDGYVVGQVTDVTLPEAPKDGSKEMADLDELVGKSLKQDIAGQFVSQMSKGKKIQVNKHILDQTYGPQPKQAQ